MSSMLAVPYLAFSGRQLCLALLARITDFGSTGLRPVRLLGALSTFNAPFGAGCAAGRWAASARWWTAGPARAAVPVARVATAATASAWRTVAGRAVMP